MSRKKSNLIIQILLLFVSTVLSTGMLISKPVQEAPALIIQICLCLAAILCTALYCFVLYRQPHGNMLKYAIIVAAAVNTINSALAIASGANIYFSIITLLCSCAICYTSGRLDRSKEVVAILSISAIIFAFEAIYYIINGNNFEIIISVNFVCIILTLILAYCMRYYAHRRAGLES